MILYNVYIGILVTGSASEYQNDLDSFKFKGVGFVLMVLKFLVISREAKISDFIR